MDKKLFWLLEDNGDTSVTLPDLKSAIDIIESHLEVPQSELEQYQYTLTPVFMTDKEFENLPEAESY
jgi:hypothetical protein